MPNVMDMFTGPKDSDISVDADTTEDTDTTVAPKEEEVAQKTETETEVLDIQALADKYTKKPDASSSEIDALKQQIAELTAKLNAVAQPQSKASESDIFTEENFPHALENPQLFKQGLSKMIAGAVQDSLQSFQEMVRKTAENVSVNHVQQSAAAIEARTHFRSAFPDLAPYDDFVKMVATSLAPKFEGSSNPQEFLTIVGNVARQRLASMGVSVITPNAKKPVLPNATPGITSQTQTQAKTVGQSFIENIFGGE